MAVAMYESFHGLRERPFELTPTPRYLFLTPGHRRALINLELGLATRAGVVALIGEPGTGKTTVAQALIAKRGGITTFVYLNQSLTSSADLRQSLVESLNLGPRGVTSNTDLVRDLKARFADRTEPASPAALLVDEAQSLPDDVLEEIRLLSNIETASGRLLTLALIGQPKLAARLNEDMWAQLKQRIEIRSALTPLELTESAAYICSRVKTAGGDAAQLFTADAIRLIHECARGTPRTINVICENALVAAFAEQTHQVTQRLVQQVCAELDLLPAASAAAAPAAVAMAAPVAAAAASVSSAAAALPRPPATTPAPASRPPELLPRRDTSASRDRLARSAAPSRRWWFLPRAWLRS